MSKTKFNECWIKIEHFDRAVQLKQIYEWVKTGYISLAQFTGLIGLVHEAEVNQLRADLSLTEELLAAATDAVEFAK
jgi:hypothetical protein